MSTFHLTIVTPGGCKFDGEAESVSVYGTEGALQCLAHHADFVTTLGMGPASVVLDGKHRNASCIGGMFSMTGNVARIIASAFEWADEIDVERAKLSLERAEEMLAKSGISEADKTLATAAKQRALVRLNCAEGKK